MIDEFEVLDLQRCICTFNIGWILIIKSLLYYICTFIAYLMFNAIHSNISISILAKTRLIGTPIQTTEYWCLESLESWTKCERSTVQSICAMRLDHLNSEMKSFVFLFCKDNDVIGGRCGMVGVIPILLLFRRRR